MRRQTRKKKARNTAATENKWIAFLRDVKGQNLSQLEKRRLYSKVKRQQQIPPPVESEQNADEKAVLIAAPNCSLRHDMSIVEISVFVARVAPLRQLGFHLTGIVGSGSYGLVLDVVDRTGVPHVMKVSRIAEQRGIPLRFPILNNQKTSWHTIKFNEFQRGVKAQQRMCKMFPNIRIPQVVHAGCVDLHDEKIGIVIMQKVYGTTLRKVLQCKSVSTKTKHVLVKKAGRLAAQLHRGGVVHGDFHVWNILCDSSGHLHMIDFDRTCNSTHSAHRLHDIGMSLDTMDEDFWLSYTKAYFGSTNCSLPFILSGHTKEERKAELHTQSRELFRQYLDHLQQEESNPAGVFEALQY